MEIWVCGIHFDIIDSPFAMYFSKFCGLKQQNSTPNPRIDSYTRVVSSTYLSIRQPHPSTIISPTHWYVRCKRGTERV